MKELRVSRRQILTGAAAVGGLAAVAGPMGVFAADQTAVTVQGNVSLPGLTVHLGAAASGPAGALKGAGFDSPAMGSGASGAPGNPGVCEFPLTGSVSAGVVTLSGAVKESSEPNLIGILVKITANSSTGSITFDFGPFTLTGTGSVNVH